MIYKLLGALVITLSCGGVGFSMAMSHRNQVRSLQELIAAVSFMKSELEYRCVPLPELCRKTAQVAKGSMVRFLLELSKELDSQICPDVNACVNNALTKSGRHPDQTRNIILKLSLTLGCFSLSGQIEGFERAIQQAEKELQELTFDQDKRLRRYQTLGLSAGAALAILLI